jgi:drug/metabolite transporter (DMT)-like permease
VVVSACCFGSIAPLTVLATANGAPLPSIQFWRYLTCALLLGAATWQERRRLPVDPGRAPWRMLDLTLLGGGAQFSVAALTLSALRYLPAATVGFLFYTFPVWVTLWSAVRGIERLTPLRLLALACAVGGITLMVGAPGGSAMSPTGILLALAAAVVYALYIPLMGVRQRGLPALGVSHAVAVGGTFWFLVWGAGTGALLAVPTLPELALSVAMGVLTTFAFFGFLTGLAGLGPVRAAITSTVEPLWTVLLGVLLLDQTLGTGALIGGVSVLLAVILLTLRPGRVA